MKLSPKTRRNIARVIPFGLIWLLMGWVFILVETAAMGTFSPNSSTIINLTWPVFIFASIAVTIVGLLVGLVEIFFMERLFRNKSFFQKIIYKFGLYVLIMLLINAITYPLAASFESNIPITDKVVWEKFGRYMVSITFLSTMLQMAVSILLCVMYATISENLGFGILTNFLTGKYHQPVEENRIFMFLDLKSSTTVAEKLGHIRYFELLKEYYSDLSNAIINHLGEVYQYIGDEIVISWNYKNGVLNANCIKCFFAMKEDLRDRSGFYERKFGVIPSFKAGIHIGNVTTGEIGALKKEIFFTGDVLNATSRIQGMCNDYRAELLVSEELISQLSLEEIFIVKSLGEVNLKGRTEPMELYSIQIS